jgi:hypothetical protein
MCSINHDLKALFIHIPKTAGIYIRSTLEKNYDFDLFYFVFLYFSVLDIHFSLENDNFIISKL